MSRTKALRDANGVPESVQPNTQGSLAHTMSGSTHPACPVNQADAPQTPPLNLYTGPVQLTADRPEVQEITRLLRQGFHTLRDYYAVGEQLQLLSKDPTLAGRGTGWRTQLARIVGQEKKSSMTPRWNLLPPSTVMRKVGSSG